MSGDMDGVLHITNRDGNLNVFNVESNNNGLWLNNNWATPGSRWNLDSGFVFCFRKYFFLSRLRGAIFLFRVI